MQNIQNIQAISGWQTHSGGNIGGDPAKVYTMDQTSKAPAALLTISGFTNKGDYEDVDWYLAVPNPSVGLSTLCHSYTLTVSESSLVTGQAVETDVLVIGQTKNKGQVKFNRSFQNDYAAGGQLQIAAEDGSWVSIGATPGPYAPNVPHEIQIFSTFDFVNALSSTVLIVIDNVPYWVPSKLQGVPAASSNWTEETLVQLQLDLNTKDGEMTALYDNVDLTWSE